MTMLIPELPPPGQRLDAGADLAEAFADLIGRLHDEGGGDGKSRSLICLAAFMTSRATSNGNACARLDDSPSELPPRWVREWPTAARWRDALISSPMVAIEGAQDTFRPLILDSAGRLYLHRYWDYEVHLVERLRALNFATPPADMKEAKSLLERLFPNPEGLKPNWQKVAAAVALLRRLCVISGGPGTGKTTTVVKILAVLLTLEPKLRIALAAPTGKAAARMQESIRHAADKLPVSRETLDGMPKESHTLHRLLGYRPSSVGFRHNRQNPLPYDVIIVDEASMLDLALAAKLFDAVGDDARVILLGDKDQLASVETGAVFADICGQRSLTPEGATLVKKLSGFDVAAGLDADSVVRGFSDAIVWLRHSYRFSQDGGIGKLAAQINRGDSAAALATLREGDGSELSWNEESPDTETLADKLIPGYTRFIEALRNRVIPVNVLKAFESYRVLCAVKEGGLGTRRLNEALAIRLRTLLGDNGSNGRWFNGRPVMMTANDYALKLYNGDIGVALANAQGDIMVYFTHPDGSTRTVAPSRLASCETAFAMTVHKSQGSEFDCIDVVLPSVSSQIVTRELLYTAITRARTSARLWGLALVISEAIARRIDRSSGLSDRLAK